MVYVKNGLVVWELQGLDWRLEAGLPPYEPVLSTGITLVGTFIAQPALSIPISAALLDLWKRRGLCMTIPSQHGSR